VRVYAAINGKAASRGQLAIFQKRRQAGRLFEIHPPEPDAIHTAGQPIGHFAVEIIDRGHKQQLGIDLPLRAVNLAHVLAGESLTTFALV